MRRRIKVEEKGMVGGGEGRLICAGSGRGREGKGDMEGDNKREDDKREG